MTKTFKGRLGVTGFVLLSLSAVAAGSCKENGTRSTSALLRPRKTLER